MCTDDEWAGMLLLRCERFDRLKGEMGNKDTGLAPATFPVVRRSCGYVLLGGCVRWPVGIMTVNFRIGRTRANPSEIGNDEPNTRSCKRQKTECSNRLSVQ